MAINGGYEVSELLFKIRNSPSNTVSGLQLSYCDHIIFNIFLRGQSRISHKVTEKLVLVFPPFILPILLNESDSHNTFLSLTLFRNSEAALSPTKVYGCCVTTKHYSSPSVSPPPAWTWAGQVKKKCRKFPHMLLTYRCRDYSLNEKRIPRVWPRPNNGCYNPILTLLPVPSLHPPLTSAKYTALSIVGQLRKTPWKVWSSIENNESWGWPSITMGQEKISGLCWENEHWGKASITIPFLRGWSCIPVSLNSYPQSSTSQMCGLRPMTWPLLCLTFLTWKVGIILVLSSLNFHEY